jgi:hypothetical protein
VAYRILIVDDDIELLKMLKNYFEIKRNGYIFIIFCNVIILIGKGLILLSKARKLIVRHFLPPKFHSYYYTYLMQKKQENEEINISYNFIK